MTLAPLPPVSRTGFWEEMESDGWFVSNRTQEMRVQRSSGRGPRGGGMRVPELVLEKRAGLLGHGAFGPRLLQHASVRGPRPSLPWPGAAALHYRREGARQDS